jgi:hypothetical protein
VVLDQLVFDFLFDYSEQVLAPSYQIQLAGKMVDHFLVLNDYQFVVEVLCMVVLLKQFLELVVLQ